MFFVSAVFAHLFKRVAASVCFHVVQPFLEAVLGLWRERQIGQLKVVTQEYHQ